jgi:hypothetical protein
MFVAGILAGACVLVLLPRRGPPSPEGRVGRAAALALFGYLALAFTSRLGVAAHHLVPVVPLAAIVVVLASRRLANWRGAKLVSVGVAAVYAAMCGSVFVDAARGIRATGGVGPWSDAVEKVAEVLEDRYSRRAVYLLGWGLENNLFVLSGGSIASAELSVSDVGAPGDAGARAPEIAVDPDAVYVVRRWERDETTSSRLARFLDRIDRAESPFRRTRVFQRDGAPYADIYAVPGRDPAPARITATFPSTIVAGYGFNVQPSGESALALQGSGFHPSDCVWWNARPLATTFGNPGLISARVPARLFGDPGSVRITIRRGNRIEPGAEARIPIVARR